MEKPYKFRQMSGLGYCATLCRWMSASQRYEEP